MEEFKHRDFIVRAYHPPQDVKSVQRIWHECGWYRDSDLSPIEDFYSVGATYVAALDGMAECVAHAAPGTMRYQDEDLSLCAFMTVVTSLIARKRGLGQAVTAHTIAQAAADGAEVASLGSFEQGFYDQLGFGCGSYQHVIAFDPSQLKRTSDFRIPRRLTKDDWPELAHAMQHRWIGHGGCLLFPPEIVKAQTALIADGFGLGYFDEQGELTHFFFGKLENEYGPLNIAAMAYQNAEQLLELFALLRSLADQVSLVSMIEPPHLQLQDLLEQPFRLRRLSSGSAQENYHRASSFWQLRMLDLEKCLSKTHLLNPRVEFNLLLSDPIGDCLGPNRKAWTGIGGEYTVTLGEDSSAKPGINSRLPTLRATVNAFSRLWLGIRPATHLAISDDVDGPTELLEQLDAVVRLPTASWGWYF